MPTPRPLPVIAGLLCLALSAPVAASDLWSVTSPKGSCHISFDQDPVAEGIFAVTQHDSACPENLKAISGYSMNNGDGTIILYSTASGLEQVARADKEQPGIYVGMTLDGESLQIVHSDVAEPQPELKPEPAAGKAGCLPYAGGGCAQPNDIGAPDVAAGVTSIHMVTRMNIRAMPGTEGAVLGRVEAGQCLEIVGCVEQNGTTVWCEVEMKTYRGWVLKQDDRKVYARNACG